MTECGPIDRQGGLRAIDDLAVQLTRSKLFLAAGFVADPMAVSVGELVERHQVEDVDVSRREIRIPRRDAPAPDDDQTVARDSVLCREPADEGDPIEGFV